MTTTPPPRVKTAPPPPPLPSVPAGPAPGAPTVHFFGAEAPWTVRDVSKECALTLASGQAEQGELTSTTIARAQQFYNWLTAQPTCCEPT